MLNELGGFYAKVGQVVRGGRFACRRVHTSLILRRLSHQFASKGDLLPPAYIRRLRTLFDKCPPASFASVKRTIERELKRPVASLFASLDPLPLATATIAQVHRATLFDGTRLAVKVQHRGQEARMRSDIASMCLVCRAVAALKLDLNFDQVSIMREYAEQIPLEFDFDREREALVSVGGSLAAALPALRLRCPSAIPRLCTRRVLTMTFLDGVPVSALQRRLEAARCAGQPPPPGCSPSEVGAAYTTLLTAYGHMIFCLGVFHSDPHPGNLLFCPDGFLGLIDFGEARGYHARKSLHLPSSSRKTCCSDCSHALLLRTPSASTSTRPRGWLWPASCSPLPPARRKRPAACSRLLDWRLTTRRRSFSGVRFAASTLPFIFQ